MITETLILDSKAFSINAMHYKNKSFTTAAYKDWASNIFSLLNQEPNLTRLKVLRDYFDPKKHRYVVEMITYFPYNILFTQEQKMSAKAFDVTNIEKPLQDLITMSKYFTKPDPYGVENLNMDDKHVSDFTSRKRVSQTGEHYIEYKISIMPLEDIMLTDESND